MQANALADVRVREDSHPRTIPASLVVVVLLALVGVGLRVWRLDAKSLWWDEAFTHLVSTHPPLNIVSFVHTNDGHPPLYYLLVNLVVSVWRGEAALRALSVLAGALTVVVTYLLGQRLFGHRTALIAAGLVAVAPAHIMASQEGRMYALLGLWVLLWWGALWLAAFEHPRLWVAYALITALALYTHYLSIGILASQGLFVLVDGSARRALRAWVLATTAGIALFLPWVPALTDQIVAGRMFPADRPPLNGLSLAEVGALFQFGGGAYQSSPYIVHQRGTLGLEYYPALLLPLLVVMVAALIGQRSRPRQGLFLFCYLAVPIAVLFLVSVWSNLFQVRYFVILIPAYALAAAGGIAALAEGWHRLIGRGAWVRGFMLLWLGLFAAAGLHTYYAARTWDGHDWRAGVGLVDARAGPLDTLALIPGMINVPYRVYSRHLHLTLLGDPLVWVDPTRAADRDKDRQILRNAAAAGNDIWLLTLAPLASPLTGALAEDLRGVVRPGERWGYGDFIIVHFTHALQ